MTKTFITAEIGINWNQDINTMKCLIDVALNAGADAVKFQLWHPKTFPKLEQYRMDKQVLIDAVRFLCAHQWYCTAFDIESIDFLDSLDMKYWKVPSNPVIAQRLDLLYKIFDIATNRKHLFFSTGCSSIKELKFFSEKAPPNTTWMHCVSEYPCPIESAHLSRIDEIKEKLTWHDLTKDEYDITEPNMGLSDHSGTIELPVAAVAMGATAIEVHITLDKEAAGLDHKSSLEPAEFQQMVKMIRNIEKAI
jgi:N,N'-diacetyllegionaminate synthase